MLFLPLGITVPLMLFPGILMLIRSVILRMAPRLLPAVPLGFVLNARGSLVIGLTTNDSTWSLTGYTHYTTATNWCWEALQPFF